MARRRGARGRRLPKALPREQWDRIIEAAGEDRREPLIALRDQAIIALFFFSGLRCGELVALDLADVDWERGRVRVRHGKGDKERIPAVSPAALDLLEAYVDVRPEFPGEERGGPLFVSRKGGRLTTAGVRFMVAGIEKRLGGTGIHPHAFRHSHITEIVRQAGRRGKSIFDVAEQAGHADLDTTRLYYAANAEDRKELVDEL